MKKTTVYKCLAALLGVVSVSGGYMVCSAMIPASINAESNDVIVSAGKPHARELIAQAQTIAQQDASVRVFSARDLEQSVKRYGEDCDWLALGKRGDLKAVLKNIETQTGIPEDAFDGEKVYGSPDGSDCGLFLVKAPSPERVSYAIAKEKGEIKDVYIGAQKFFLGYGMALLAGLGAGRFALKGFFPNVFSKKEEEEPPLGEK
jgi:hypothetical protein